MKSIALSNGVSDGIIRDTTTNSQDNYSVDDEEYLDAVERGDMERAQEMVDEGEEDIRYSVDDEDDYRTEGVHWLYETGEVSRGDVRFVWQTIANIGKRGYNGYARTYNGEYIADNGNKIFFKNADYRSPYVSRLIVLADTYETNMARVKELIRNAKGHPSRHRDALQIGRNWYGEEYITEYNGSDYRSNAWEDGGREGTDSGRADSEDRVGRNPIDAYSADDETGESGTAGEAYRSGIRNAARDSLPTPKKAEGDLLQTVPRAPKSTEELRKAREERIRNKPREEFSGTAAINKLGIKIEGSVGDYEGTDRFYTHDVLIEKNEAPTFKTGGHQ